MKILGKPKVFKGQILQDSTDVVPVLPANATAGQIFASSTNRIFVCISNDKFPVWAPLPQEISSYNKLNADSTKSVSHIHLVVNDVTADVTIPDTRLFDNDPKDIIVVELNVKRVSYKGNKQSIDALSNGTISFNAEKHNGVLVTTGEIEKTSNSISGPQAKTFQITGQDNQSKTLTHNLGCQSATIVANGPANVSSIVHIDKNSLIVNFSRGGQCSLTITV